MMPSSTLPSGLPDQNYVTVSPIGSQSITLPDKFFVSPADPDARRSVPSLAFLVTHPGPPSHFHLPRSSREINDSDQDVGATTSTPARVRKPLRMLFDLGLRSSKEGYLPQQQEHLKNRNPYSLSPSVAETLEYDGDVRPEGIDLAVLSHVHYDHHGDPSDYPNAQFIVGPGATMVLKEGLGGLASHQHFDPDLLPADRTSELLPPTTSSSEVSTASAATQSSWKPLGPFPAALDFFNDGSVYIIHAPGHLPGHLNLLCRIGAERWIYLAGDSAHDGRLLSGEKEVGTWKDGEGNEMCVHLEKKQAEETIGRIRQLMETESERVEVVLAHDEAWRDAMMAKGCFYPNVLK